MLLSASEKATLNFYNYDYRLRGYYHFDGIVDIEPPYIPFHHIHYTDDVYIDDGKVPNLFKRVVQLFENKEQDTKEDVEFPEVLPNPVGRISKLTGFSISFPKDQDISQSISIEFLNMLAFSNNTLSFEILGTQEYILIHFVCSKDDEKRVRSNLKAYFPKVAITDLDVQYLPFDIDSNIAIADFGLQDESMRPLQSVSNFAIDPLTSIIATLDNLNDGETVFFQLIFKGVTAPWSKDIIHSVSDGQGGSFFSDAPEMLACAKDKVSSPLFSCVMRIATQGTNDNQSQYLAQELARNISSVSTSQYNKLIPLSNEEYEYNDHLYNLYNRTSNRLGMLLNTNELVNFVHYPNKSIVSEKLHPQCGKTKLLPNECINQKYVLGINAHSGVSNIASLSNNQRLQHCHILGVTGVGKSTLIANMMLGDMEAGNGCVLFDPHGDISDDLMLRIPEQRKNDVVIIDPSDTNYPIGFNLLAATTDAEKIVLSSDLVSSFKRHATAWGDNMTAVLSNVINTFLESSTGGTLIELKRFLIEERFRNSYLKNVDDQSILYYWKYEYPMVKKGIAPLLTRIDTFLRPKIIRYMFAQKDGIDFNDAIANKKIIIIKLSLGLIGEENSYLLGSLFLSKINQVAHGRQSLAKNERHPYYVYLDEFHNFITPSITSMLSGARKYGIGLTLAHQELGQIENPKILNSVISNPHIRICFRLGDNDARKLESGFSFFEQTDLQSLNLGEVIMRVGSSTNDFNIQTYPLHKITDEQAEIRKEYVINTTRNKYAKEKDEVLTILNGLLPHSQNVKQQEKKKKLEVAKLPLISESKNTDALLIDKDSAKSPKKKQEKNLKNDTETSELDQQKEAYLLQRKERESIKRHRYLQTYIGQLAQQRGFKICIEKQTKDGKKIDVVLQQDKHTIAIEIAITNSLDYEVKNIKKCIDNGYINIWIVSDSKVHLSNIEKRAKGELGKKIIKTLSFVLSDVLIQKLDSFCGSHKPKTKRIQGYRVTTSFKDDVSLKADIKQNEITDMILQSMRKKKEK